MAEKEGFEPSLRFSRTTPLAGEPLEPLGYFSLKKLKFIVFFFYSFCIIAYFLCGVKNFFSFSRKSFPLFFAPGFSGRSLR